MVKKNWDLKKFGKKKFGNKKIIHVTGRGEGGRIEERRRRTRGEP